MTLLAFVTLDYAVLIGYSLLMIAVGFVFSRQSWAMLIAHQAGL